MNINHHNHTCELAAKDLDHIAADLRITLRGLRDQGAHACSIRSIEYAIKRAEQSAEWWRAHKRETEEVAA